MGFIPSDPLTRANTMSNKGAFCAYSGQKTGRVPSAKSIVTDALREKEIGWGEINKRMSNESFKILEDMAMNYLNTRSMLYIVDGYAGWDEENRIKIRVICSRAYHALFMRNMLIRPSPRELE